MLCFVMFLCFLLSLRFCYGIWFFLCFLLELGIFRVGLDLPAIEVRFEHLEVEAEAHTAGRALPTMFNFSLNMFEVKELHTKSNFISLFPLLFMTKSFHLFQGILELLPHHPKQKETTINSS